MKLINSLTIICTLFLILSLSGCHKQSDSAKDNAKDAQATSASLSIDNHSQSNHNADLYPLTEKEIAAKSGQCTIDSAKIDKTDCGK